MKSFWINNKKAVMASVAFAFVVTFIFAGATGIYSEKIQQGIADEVIRLHILANSDSPEDQALKLQVRDGILAAFSDRLGKAGSIAESRAILEENLDEIVTLAESIMADNGYGYTAAASLSQSWFSTRVYGDLSFPAGSYEALKVTLGDGDGANWWCVMFPPLCFVDITLSKTTDETQDKLKDILSNEEYDIVAKANTEEITPVKVKFKLVEIWQEIKSAAHRPPVEVAAN